MRSQGSKVIKLIVLTMALGCYLSGYALTPRSLSDSLNAYAKRYAVVQKRIRVENVRDNGKRITVNTNQALSFISLSPEEMEELKRSISYWIKGDSTIPVTLTIDNQDISFYITSRYKGREMSQHHRLQDVVPLVSNLSRPYTIDNGLDGQHIALWASHGLYYKQDEDRWRWQRARLWTTVEDLYTSIYTHSFLVPMLENAGAVVLQPRERDPQTEEVITDDSKAVSIGKHNWKEEHAPGWGEIDHPLTEKENPFLAGHYLSAPCKDNTALRYTPTIQQEGEYAVYVSYATLPHSTDHALYTIVHQGDTTHLRINQQMGGGTWIYIGTYTFGANPKKNHITVSAHHEADKVITSDAIRLGGGWGNVARKPLDEDHTMPGIVSGFPRFAEGARYYLQYCGIPDSVYSLSKGKNDYFDDHTARGRWVNYLCGGSEAYPEGVGLNIPVALCMALHSDAGSTMNNDIIGTLAIYSDLDKENMKDFPAGGSRQCNRDLADLMQTQIVEDIRHTVCPQWTRRETMNGTYSEARNPKVPCALIELLSHQNFADMQYGLDPKFQFLVSRSIYKSILRFLHEQKGTPYVVQPLPPHAFRITPNGLDSLDLEWKEQQDTLEESATPTYYVLYTRQQGGDWDEGRIVHADATGGGHLTIGIEKGIHYEYKVRAGNAGGVSLPSCVLSACLQKGNRPMVMIVDGFDRVCAPKMVAFDSLTGGILPECHGIPYMKNVGYIGEQTDFDRTHAWKDDDECGFGMCHADLAREVTIGNTFDYSARHGRWLHKMGYSYVSSSAEAIDTLGSYALVDVIMGKQTAEDGCFPMGLRNALTTYLNHGGRVLVSGAFIASDMRSKQAAQWVKEILHYQYHAVNATHNGRINLQYHVLPQHTYHLWVEPNENSIECEAPDGIEPVGGAVRIGRYDDSGVTAGIAYKRQIIALPFMLESITEAEKLYKDCINYFHIQ